MITAIEDVFYYVSDHDRALAFYTGLLGMQVVYRDPVWVGLVLAQDAATDPVKVGLLRIEGPVPECVEERGGRRVHPGATLSLRTDNLEAEVARLVAAGVPLVRPIDRGPWGAGALIADPEGNVLMLYEPPGTMPT